MEHGRSVSIMITDEGRTTISIVAGRDGPVERSDLFGVLSLMVWALVVVVPVKSVVFVMRADHDGEGGILVLPSLVPPVLVHQVERTRSLH